MLVLIGQSTHRRNLGDAGRAPGRPKIENDRMSSKAAKSHDISIQIPKRKIGRHRRNVRCGLARIACQTKDAQDKLDCQPSQLIHRDPLSGEERRVNGNRICGMPSSFGGVISVRPCRISRCVRWLDAQRPLSFTVSVSKRGAPVASERVSRPGPNLLHSVGRTSKSDRLKIVKGSLHLINSCQTIQFETLLNRGKLLCKDHAS